MEKNNNSDDKQNTDKRWGKILSCLLLIIAIALVFPAFKEDLGYMKFLQNIEIIRLILFLIFAFILKHAAMAFGSSVQIPKELQEIDLQVKNTNQQNENIIDENIKINSNAYKVIDYQIKQLRNQIGAAEEKASILLTNGKFFIWIGIIFYAISIFIWQFFTWGKVATNGNIIGMFECTTIFIFFEIIAAWYLKQYRHYVDKSTYLVKVKAIFDKYLINYLLAEEDKFENIKYKDLFEYFSKEINWPKDNHLNKNKSDDIHESLLGIIKEFATSKKEQ